MHDSYAHLTPAARRHHRNSTERSSALRMRRRGHVLHGVGGCAPGGRAGLRRAGAHGRRCPGDPRRRHNGLRRDPDGRRTRSPREGRDSRRGP
ncbi:hypothetical protein ACFPRL_27950 [Pseudoclavibacter helvolus]